MNNDYKKLVVWQKSIELVELIYNHTKKFPKEEIYGLTNQIRRAVVSIPSNISEGYGRNSQNELKQFLIVAKGSAFECETQLFISLKLNYLDEENFNKLNSLNIEIIKILTKLITTL